MPDAAITPPTIETGEYQHYKGSRYEVLGVGLDTEDLQPLVIYRPLYKSAVKYWVRPYDMFIDMVEVDGQEISRFQRITSD